MLRTLINAEYAYLRDSAPHARTHYITLHYAIGLGISPLLGIHYFVSDTILSAVLTGAILLVYWQIQLRIVRAGVVLARHELPLADAENVSSSSAHQWQAKLGAVLWHYRYFIGGSTLAITGLTLYMLLFLFYLLWIPNATGAWRGIWQYVGVPSGGYQPFPYRYVSSLAMVQVSLLAPLCLLALTLSNSILSACLGLWAGYVSRAWALRGIVNLMLLVVLLNLYALRQTPVWACARSWMYTTDCSLILLPYIRVIDSVQAVALTFSDGGVGLVTGLFNPQGRELFALEGYQIRHFAIFMVTILSQLGLSALLLRRRDRWRGKPKS